MYFEIVFIVRKKIIYLSFRIANCLNQVRKSPHGGK